MADTTPTDAMVEAGARALYEDDPSNSKRPWDDVPRAIKSLVLHEVRVALTAALQHQEPGGTVLLGGAGTNFSQQLYDRRVAATPPAPSALDRARAAGFNEAKERAVKWIDGFKCTTCGVQFSASDGHPEPECEWPDWERMTDEERATALQAMKQGGSDD